MAASLCCSSVSCRLNLKELTCILSLWLISKLHLCGILLSFSFLCWKIFVRIVLYVIVLCELNSLLRFICLLTPLFIFFLASVLSCPLIAVDLVLEISALCSLRRMLERRIILCPHCKLRMLGFIQVRSFGEAFRWRFLKICFLLSGHGCLTVNTTFIDSFSDPNLWLLSQVAWLCFSYLWFS